MLVSGDEQSTVEQKKIKTKDKMNRLVVTTQSINLINYCVLSASWHLIKLNHVVLLWWHKAALLNSKTKLFSKARDFFFFFIIISSVLVTLDCFLLHC